VNTAIEFWREFDYDDDDIEGCYRSVGNGYDSLARCDAAGVAETDGVGFPSSIATTDLMDVSEKSNCIRACTMLESLTFVEKNMMARGSRPETTMLEFTAQRGYIKDDVVCGLWSIRWLHLRENRAKVAYTTPVTSICNEITSS
jgi:hypothetical protein